MPSTSIEHRQAIIARMHEILDTAEAKGRNLTTEERAEYDGLENVLSRVDGRKHSIPRTKQGLHAWSQQSHGRYTDSSAAQPPGKQWASRRSDGGGMVFQDFASGEQYQALTVGEPMGDAAGFDGPAVGETVRAMLTGS